MSIDGWEREELNRLHRRVEALEKQVHELDGRTGGLVRLGPQEYELNEEEIQQVTNRILDSIPPFKAKPSGLISKLGA